MLSARALLISITILSGWIALSLGIIVAIAGFKTDIRRKRFALFAFATSLWIVGGQLAPVLLKDPVNAQTVNIIGQSTVNLVALSFAFFLFTFINNKKTVKILGVSLLALLPLAEMFLIFSNSISKVYIDAATGFLSYDYNLNAYPIIIAFPLLAVLVPLVLMARQPASRSQQDTFNKYIKRSLSYSSIAYAVAILVITYIIPSYIYDYLLLEFTLFNLVTLTYLYYISKQLFRNKLVDLKKNGWRAIIRFTVQALFVTAIAYTSEFIPQNVPTGRTHELFVRVYVVLAAVTGWVVGGRVATRYLQRYQISLATLNSGLQPMRSELDINRLSKMFAEALVKVLKVDIVLIVDIEKSQKFHEPYVFLGDNSSKVEHGDLSQEDQKTLDKFIPSLSKEDGVWQVYREKLSSAGMKDFYHGVLNRANGQGALVLTGEKVDGDEFDGNDIAVLNAAVNEYVLALQNARQYSRIKEFNIELEAKIKEATRDLRRTNEKLKALDETKDEFISMASHQLRTPLTSVKGYVSMVLEGDAGKITKQQRSLLDQAFLSSQRMVYLIADLLNVSRLRTGKFVIENKPTQLADVIEGEIEQLEETAKSKNMALTYHRPKAFPLLNLDETKIRQVVMNFADNALYYTPAGGKIDIYLEDKGQSIEFRVSDNGIGVPKREQHHLFSKFYRAGNAQKARPDGTGLGLFMAKKVVVAQGGVIIFRSEEGKGSTFGFSFPKKAVQVAAK